VVLASRQIKVSALVHAGIVECDKQNQVDQFFVARSSG